MCLQWSGENDSIFKIIRIFRSSSLGLTSIPARSQPLLLKDLSCRNKDAGIEVALGYDISQLQIKSAVIKLEII